MDPGRGFSLSREALKDSSSQARGRGLQTPQAAGGLRQAVRCEASPTPPCEMLSAVWGSGRPAHTHRMIGSSTGGPGGSSVHRRGLSQSPGLIATQVPSLGCMLESPGRFYPPRTEVACLGEGHAVFNGPAGCSPCIVQTARCKYAAQWVPCVWS